MILPGKLCIALTGHGPDALAEQLATVTLSYDVVEIRLDGMRDPNVAACLATIQHPVLCTNRPAWEGGKYHGSEQERVALLEQAVELRAAYIDIELETDTALRTHIIQRAEAANSKVIVSHHDFARTPGPEVLRNTLNRMQDSGGTIGKIITTAQHPTDVARVLSLLALAKDMDFPLIAFCMGETGRISRFATLYMGGYMTYLSLEESQETAPGQFSLKHFHSLTTLFTKTP
ncbi:MAG: type I 3-dehydroquinate dehydratase [Desulfobulbus propionicus]|nr:MAG: type I 3-dehydroquinate dehydratase [Desulfobulbus propionicus]